MKNLYESILGSTNTGRSTFEVDLGLSVNWCAYNVGAKKPEEEGMYFAWGDTKGYKSNEIKDEMFNGEWYSKLQASILSSTLRLKSSTLKLKDDAANVYMHWKWRIPTEKDFNELKQKTKQSVEELNGVSGMRFIGTNGNSIFIPFSGMVFNGKIFRKGYEFNCLSSNISKDNQIYILSGNRDGDVNYDPDLCYCGFSIRAVCNK